jgi:hypothetical protein
VKEIPVILSIPENVFVTLMCSWALMVLIAFACGYWMGRSHEITRRIR